ncbi:MAG: peptidoglycan-binding protein [Hyphomicrobiales bacterium]|nr:peptidoglycan-binding protein [Hyphomicrobiales bacterium]
MNTKRSYIESLNAGRPRREHATLEELNRSLAGMDERFGGDPQQPENEREAGEAPLAWRSAGDFERGRARESGVASMSRIASELNTLREELRSRLEGASDTGGERGSYSAFPRDAGPRDPGPRDPGIDTRTTRTTDAYPPVADEHMIFGIADRVEQIHAAVANLPDSLSISSLEDKVKMLATAVEQLARQKEMPGATTFEAIEERLDEISRAIVASSAQPAPDAGNGHLERIEARITSLSRQLEELVEDRPTDAVMKQLSQLSARVEDIAGRAELPEATVDRLSHQIDLIVEKLEGGAQAVSPDAILEGMERRFETLTQALEQRHETAREQSVALFRDLEERLERYNQDALSTDAAIVEALNKRFTDLEDAISRHDGMEPEAAGLFGSPQQHGRPLPEFDDIGPRLAMIERSVNESREAIIVAAREAAEQAVRSQSLPEGDVAVLSGLASELQSLEKLARRFDERNGRTFEAIHDTLLKIVDRLGALESGPSSSVTSSAPPPAAETEAVRKLEFAEAPSLDMEDTDPLPQPALEHAVRSPAGAPRGGAAGAMPKGEAVRDPKRSPAEAAAAAAMAALSNSDTAVEKSKAAPKKSRLGKLSKVLSRKKAAKDDAAEERLEPSAVAEPDGEAAPEVGLDQPLDPKLANRPLEPGSGAPDLNAIMRRVRDERGDEGRARDAEAAKSDFIAAARRAAQAAAAEAEVLKKKSEPKGSSGGFSLKRLLRSNTKIVLLAAGIVLVGVAGAQLGKALMKDSGHKTVVQKASVANTRSTDPSAVDASKTVAAKPDAAMQEAALSPLVPLPEKSETSDIAANTGPSASGKDEPVMAAASPTDELPDHGNVEAAMPAQGNAAAAVQDHLSPAGTALAKAPDGPNAAPAASADAARIATPAPADAADAAPVEESLATSHDEAAATPHESAPVSSAMMPVPNDAGPAPLREAAGNGDPKAIFEIGSRYAEGRGVASDTKTAAKWYAEAAGLGYAPAEYRIGNFYEKGIGVERDIAKAREWYVKAADQGNAAAMHNLGVLYAMGAAGSVDNEAAVRWFEKAAELGVKDSQFNLGILAAKGVGMPQSLEESYKWFALVAKTGDKDAAAKRDEVANSLRPEQLQKARATAELWKPKPVDQAANIVDIPDAWKESDMKTASIDMKQAVRNIQLILNKNGYDAGSADGIMGERTKSAIAAFQKANGMEPNGEVNEALVTALLKKK